MAQLALPHGLGRSDNRLVQALELQQRYFFRVACLLDGGDVYG
jgi:hypothetical protein